jgi:hypothetical protein
LRKFKSEEVVGYNIYITINPHIVFHTPKFVRATIKSMKRGGQDCPKVYGNAVAFLKATAG